MSKAPATSGLAMRIGAIIATFLTASPAFADPDFAGLASANRIVLAAEARDGCLPAFAEPIVDRPCHLEKFGDVATLDGHSFAYALYMFSMADGGTMGARTLLFERIDADHLRVLFVPENEGGPFETPELIHAPARVLLHIPGADTGTGNFNRERLYVWRNPRWLLLDTTSWLDTLQRRLPRGLGAWKGIYPDYRRMRASTPLWRTNDGNASPTGGRASVRLGWRGDKVVLVSVHLHLHLRRR